MIAKMRPGTNGGSGGVISRAACQLEAALSERLDEKAEEIKKVLDDVYHEGGELALQMARLSAVARLGAKQIVAFGWETATCIDEQNSGRSGGDHLCNLFHDLFMGERNRLLDEARKR